MGQVRKIRQLSVVNRITFLDWVGLTCSLFKLMGAQERARGGIMVAQLAGGVLKFFVLRRGKRTLWDKGATAFILPEYDVCGDVTPHMPSSRNSV